MMLRIPLLLWLIMHLIACGQPSQVAEKGPLQVKAIQLSEVVSSGNRQMIGQVVPAELTPLSFRIPGEIIELNVRPGTKVKKGQLLARLDQAKLKQLEQEAKDSFELAERQLRRATPLFDNGQLSDTEFSELKANMKLAKVNYQLASAQLQYSEMVAPFDGMVGSINHEAYETVVPGEEILTLYQHDKVYINLPLSFELLAQMKPGRTRTDYQPLASFSNIEGQFPVSLIEYTSEPVSSSRAYAAWFSMPQTNPPILPGSNVTLEVAPDKIGIAYTSGFVVPYGALIAGEVKDQFLVWKVINGRAQQISVSAGQLKPSGVLVTQGLVKGDLIITSRLQQLREGMPVMPLVQE